MTNLKNLPVPVISAMCFLMCMVAGCVLESPVQHDIGSKCSAQYIDIDGQPCMTGSCSEYQWYLDNGFCPQDYPVCIINHDVLYCTRECPDGYHRYGYSEDEVNEEVETEEEEIIIDDEITDAPNDTNDNNDVEKDDNKSVDKTRWILTCEKNSIEHCGEHEIDCRDDLDEGWRSLACKEGKCVAQSCDDIHTLIDGQCQTASACCGNECQNCERSKGSVCSNGKCLGECSEGLIRCDGTCIDPTSSLAYCGATEACESDKRCGNEQKCVNSECVCINGGAFCENHCIDVSGDLNNCGSCNNNCSVTEGWLNGECNEGTCRASECVPDYHLESQEDGSVLCVQDSVDACGDKDKNCASIIEGWGDGTCEEQNCILTQCKPDYFFYEDQCYINNNDHCGAFDIVCQNGHDCNPTTGQCECDNGEIECNGTCYDLTDSIEHCGECNHPCNVENADNKCVNKVCEFECNGTFVKNTAGDACEDFQCNNGDTRCNGDKIIKCVNNAWQTDRTCTTSKPNAVPICIPSGSSFDCSTKCASGYQDCSGTCYSNQDINHCQNCTTVCKAPAHGKAICGASGCDIDCEDGYIKSGSSCVPCTNGSHKCEGNVYKTCESNSWKNTQTCTAPTGGSVRCDTSKGCVPTCPSGKTLCGNSCINVKGNDKNNCGGCGVKCATNCINGTCGCQEDTIFCKNACVSSSKKGLTLKKSKIYTVTGGDSTGSVKAYTKHKVFGVSGNYYAIQVSGNKRYIKKSALYIFPITGVVDSDIGVNVREGPGLNYKKVHSEGNGIPDGWTVKITNFKWGDELDGYGWYYITSPKKGYVHAENIDIQKGSSPTLPDCPN